MMVFFHGDDDTTLGTCSSEHYLLIYKIYELPMLKVIISNKQWWSTTPPITTTKLSYPDCQRNKNGNDITEAVDA